MTWIHGLESRFGSVPVGFHAGLQALQAALSSGSGRESATERLQRVIADLEELNRSTESDFLLISGNLMEFLAGVHKLQSQVEGFSGRLEGEREKSTDELMGRVRARVEQMQVRLGEGNRLFGNVQKETKSILRAFSTFGKVASTFQITAILARIETAHLSMTQEDLSNLADEVQLASQGMEARAGELLAAAEALGECISRALREIASLNATELKKIEDVLAQVDEGVASSAERQRNTATVSIRLGEELKALSRELGTIAMAIQFHDITRQQVEHVVEGLRASLPPVPGGPPTRSGLALIRLQGAQLGDAALGFTRSAGQIDEDLEGVAERLGEIIRACQSLSGTGEGGEIVVGADMRERFDAVLVAITEAEAMEGGRESISAELRAIGARLRKAIVEIQAIEIQLSRLAVNTSITACHIGEVGNPLIVVAGSMQDLGADCSSRSAAAAEALGRIRAAVDSIAEVGSRGAGETQLREWQRRMEAIQAEGQASKRAVRPICALADTLGGQAQRSGGHTAIGQRFATTADRCRAVLEAMVGEFASTAAPDERTGLEEKKSLARYTMKSERAVHAAMLGGPVEEEGTSGGAATELDGDVELF
ncbi:MAG: hypothetical protein NTV52_33460 [Acidobacteria bacterium]|nr:hypothetical protein [Acidobacteriota bacterium]